jgi:curved DNA-binding protein CbpA
MSHDSFPLEWLEQFSDPYAILGVSLAADDQRVLKRYRAIAKILHPDVTSDPEIQEFSSQMLARLVNPAYQRLKQEKERAECKALLRLQVRRLNRNAPMQPNTELARQMMRQPINEVDIYYEQAISQLADSQYQSFENFPLITEQLGELNLAYLQLKMGDLVVPQEKRTGLVAATQAKPVQFSPGFTERTTPMESYAQRHYRRAQEYMQKKNWSQAVQELRDAIKLEADRSEYHSLLAMAYWQQNLLGMAKVYMRQALKLNPQDPLANKYAAKLDINVAKPHEQNGNAGQQPTAQPNQKGGLFGLFRSR